jgi:hypothetical protein
LQRRRRQRDVALNQAPGAIFQAGRRTSVTSDLEMMRIYRTSDTRSRAQALTPSGKPTLPARACR